MGEGQAQLRRLHRLLRRIRHFRRLRRSTNADGPEARKLWAGIRRGSRVLLPQAEWPTQLGGRAWPTDAKLSTAEASVDAAAATLRSQEQLQRLKGWEERLAQDWKATRAATYKWVRDDFHPRAAFMRLDDGALTGSVSAMQETAEATWKQQVYCDPARRAVDRGVVSAKYGPALRARAKPHTLAPLTGEDLAATITQWPRAKKGGTDAWEAGHFKDCLLYTSDAADE